MNPKTLDLRDLSKDESNRKINDTIAFVLGWQLHDPTETRERYISWIPPGKSRMKDGYYTAKPEKYCLSADAIIPLLGQFHLYNWHVEAEERDRLNGGFCVSLVNGPAAYAETPALAGCIALLIAHGYEVLT